MLTNQYQKSAGNLYRFPREKSCVYGYVNEGHPISNANSPIFSIQIDLSQFYLYI